MNSIYAMSQEEAESERARLEADHAEALPMNVQFDADREADIARCTATAQAMLTNGRSLVLPEYVSVRDALIDAGITPQVSDEEIVEAAIEAVVELGLDRDVAVIRLSLIDFAEARRRYEVAA
jgi:hypothetical protein